MTDRAEQKKILTEQINRWRKERYRAQRRWSAVHHSALFGSIIVSISAGALIQFEETQLATIFTAIAAVLTGIASSGGFERKWKSNRLSRSRADRLLLELDSEKANIDMIRKKLAVAIEKHDLEVVGDRNDESTEKPVT